MVWATLARRDDVDVRRLFTDAGDPPHGGPRGRGAGLELFGLSLSWGHHSGLIQSINPVLVWAAAAPSPAVS